MDEEDPALQGNLSIGGQYTVGEGLNVSPGYSEGNGLSLQGFPTPPPAATLEWGTANGLLWGGEFLQW